MVRNCEKKTDAELVALSLEDQEYFLCIIRKYQQPLLRYIRRISGVPYEDAEDVFQEVCIKVYTHLHNYNETLPFSSWIYRITRNTTISHFRKRKPVISLESMDLERLASHCMKEFVIKNDIIAPVLNKMDEKYRDILILKFLEEKSYEEISDIIKKPMGTVATWINRAKKQFQKYYDILYGKEE
ncbi:MAG: RNA polymerase sigma factor [Candidatus Magasanikbacteria bacterium]|jgi:RNA polymerase sigma-70 factor, ECF subfamily|nr:RNA polymerase sigma factor [Candidatus Magasanikbacteria bacterium]MBT4071881.1 RNA polymerase sigma factor [Candidatus Magasanikbacteria bacterium]